MGNKWEMHTYNGGTDKNRTQSRRTIQQRVEGDHGFMHVFRASWYGFPSTRHGASSTPTHRELDHGVRSLGLVNPAAAATTSCATCSTAQLPGPAMKLFDPQRVNVLRIRRHRLPWVDTSVEQAQLGYVPSRPGGVRQSMRNTPKADQIRGWASRRRLHPDHRREGEVNGRSPTTAR